MALAEKGFKQTADATVTCRFRFEDVTVDVMSTKAIGWAPGDQWFEKGFKHLEEMSIEDQPVRILPLAYFIATKFSAFHDRGSKEPRTSKDFEDITYILDNRTDLAEQILNAPEDVKQYLKNEFKNMLSDTQLQEAILGNLFYETQTERHKLILDKLKKVVDHN